MTVVRPSKVHSINRLPRRYDHLYFGGGSYYRHKSKFYKRWGARYVLVPPPFGMRLAVLPALYTIFEFNQRDYYCCDGIIYAEVDGDEFEVVEPQMGMVVPQLPKVGVQEVEIDNMIYYEFEGYLYREVLTEFGKQYKVAGSVNFTLVD
ncbi:MAG: DUF6515 family protein [Rikenellaceae bacterium]